MQEYPGQERRDGGSRPVRRRRRRGISLQGVALVLVALLLALGLQHFRHPRTVWATGTGEVILQNPELPNGCEITSLTMLLRWAGVPADKVELVQNWLPREPFGNADGRLTGPDPEVAYVGNPAQEDGWYCYEGPILDAANGYLSYSGADWQAVSLTGISQTELRRMARDGVPVAVWVTLDYGEPVYSSEVSWALPDGSQYTPVRNLHCVVLAGMERDSCRIADPLQGWQTVEWDRFWSAFTAMGSRAVALQQVDRDG